MVWLGAVRIGTRHFPFASQDTGSVPSPTDRPGSTRLHRPDRPEPARTCPYAMSPDFSTPTCHSMTRTQRHRTSGLGRQTEGWNYEASVTVCDLSAADRQALECNLLWQYRLKTGESTLANHGRFHPGYTKSRNRASGQRGGFRRCVNFRCKEAHSSSRRGHQSL